MSAESKSETLFIFYILLQKMTYPITPEAHGLVSRIMRMVFTVLNSPSEKRTKNVTIYRKNGDQIGEFWN